MALTVLGQTGTVNGRHPNQVLRDVVVMLAQQKVSGVAALTDNSGGTASTAGNVQKGSIAFANVAASGSSLAGKASTDTALGKVANAIKTLVTKANALSTSVGLPTVVDNSGATDGAGTVAALDLTVTGATTGVTVANLTPIITALDNYLYTLASITNRLAGATGKSKLNLTWNGTYASTVGAITTTTGGSAADPSVTKAVVDALLVRYAEAVATVAAKLNSVRSGVTTTVVAG